MLEEAYMEDWHLEFQISEVSWAVCYFMRTGFADSVLLRNTKTRIQGTVFARNAIFFV